jgi:hypothetical protein
MPANTKAFRAKKIVSRRLVFVSWVDPSAAHRGWIDDFWARLNGDLGALLGHEFDEPMQTAEAQSEAAEPGALAARRADPAVADSSVTDFVAVLTSRYIASNTDLRGTASTGEMARFVDRVVKADLRDRIRVFLAPIDKPNWSLWRIRDLWLSETKANAWLIRLRDDRFVWPSEVPSTSGDQIADAVALIICGSPNKG